MMMHITQLQSETEHYRINANMVDIEHEPDG